MEAIVAKFLEIPAYLQNGAGYLSKRFGVTKKVIYKAKLKARELLAASEQASLQNTIAEQEEQFVRYMGSKATKEGRVETFETLKPLQPSEITELVGADGIRTVVGMVWDKLQPSGKWTYSIQVKTLIDNFYTKEELEKRLLEIYPKDITPVRIPAPRIQVEKDHALFIYISDDHVGLKYSDSLFGNRYSGEIYESRMMSLLHKVISNPSSFEKVFVIRLGDEADGYNARTTRYDHQLESESNKKQFDIYTTVNRNFYDHLFQSGLAKSYTVINCNNSNHSGHDFSYILNRSVQFHVESRYPQVEFVHIHKFIDTIEWGNHVIGVTHGKDEKYMRKSFPLNLDKDTDLWLTEYYSKKGYSVRDRWITTVKGDLHKYNVNRGKSGRYINNDSIAGGSPYIEHNYGDTQPGALLEVYDKNSPDIGHLPIRL